MVPILIKEKRRVRLIGDFNIDLLKSTNHKSSQHFLNIMISAYFAQTINFPTRVTDSTANLIDNILTNFSQEIINPSVIVGDFSDHFPILVWFGNAVPLTKQDFGETFRMVNEQSLGHFTAALNNENWDCARTVITKGNAIAAYDEFIKTFTDLYNKSFPLMNKLKGKDSLKHPWMTKGLLKSSRIKNKTYVEYKKHPTDWNRLKYVQYRNIFKKVKKRAEKTYYENEFLKYTNDTKNTWKTIKTLISGQKGGTIIESLMVDGNRKTNPTEIANHLNEFFSGIGQSLASKITKGKNEPEDYMGCPSLNSFVLLPTCPQEIIELAMGTKYTRAEGPDGVDPLVGKRTIHSTAEIVAEIINSSFETGQIHPDLKKGKITPIFKQGDRENMSNYRPISILSFFAKIMEKAMSNRLTNYIEKIAILYPHQIGFRPGYSTDMALINIQDLITEAIDTKKFAIGIFLDLAKAFDKVDHKILLKKLEFYGIRGTPLLWFKSYLTDRSQHVNYNGILSSFRPITSGVPQGSNLGPLLFLIYINDLPNAAKSLKLVLFADDTNAFYSHESLSELNKIINSDLKLLDEWFRTNCLSLNAKKIMLYHFLFPEEKTG